MKLFSKSLFVSAVVLAVAPTSALALRPDCDTTCFVPVPCSTLCTHPWSTQVFTCGSWVSAWGNSFPENSCVQTASAAPESSCAAEMEGSAEDSEQSCRAPEQAEQAQPEEG